MSSPERKLMESMLDFEECLVLWDDSIALAADFSLCLKHREKWHDDM